MKPEIGRFFEGRLHEVVQMMLVVLDYSQGQGKDVKTWIDGRELVFGTAEMGEGSGFLRLLPHEANVVIAFPRGHDLPDPKNRAKGPRGSRTRLTVRTTTDIDLYVRRMIDAAYVIDRA